MASAEVPPSESFTQDLITVEVAWSPEPRCVLIESLRVRIGQSLLQALQSSGWWSRHLTELRGSPHNSDEPVFGIWGRRVPADHPLRVGDRIEVYRPLKVDPKEARRQRYRAQGERGRRGPSRSAPGRQQAK